MGRTKRLFIHTTIAPGPNKYMDHKRMTDHRSNSRERNAPKATFGNTSRNRFDRSKSPGPSEYNTAKRNIGDESGHHVVFAA